MELNHRQLKAIKQKHLYDCIRTEIDNKPPEELRYFFNFMNYADLPKISNERKALDKFYDVIYSYESISNIKKQIRVVLEYDKLIDMFEKYFGLF